MRLLVWSSMARVLFQVSPSDPLTLAIVAFTLTAAGLLAAAALDPLKALRYE